MVSNSIFAKYNCLTDGFHRLYLIDISERKFNIDYSYPFKLQFEVKKDWDEIGCEGNELIIHTFLSSSWVQLCKDVTCYLQAKNPKSKEELLAFKSNWFDKPVFSETKYTTNMGEFEYGLFLNLNHSSTHFSWIICELLTFYGIEKGKMLIHIPPQFEPEEIKQEVRGQKEKGFKEFLIKEQNLLEDKADKIINAIKVFNKILNKMGTSYNDLFVVDDTIALSNCKARLLKEYPKYVNWTDSQVRTARKYLDYMTSFYTKLSKTGKKNKHIFDISF